MDDALVHAAVDLGGRPYYRGPLPSRLYDHWMRSFADNARATLHLRVLRGTDRHHVVEAAFKALALAVRDAFVESLHAEDAGEAAREATVADEAAAVVGEGTLRGAVLLLGLRDRHAGGARPPRLTALRRYLRTSWSFIVGFSVHHVLRYLGLGSTTWERPRS
mgnify:CR=1 FL=1